MNRARLAGFALCSVASFGAIQAQVRPSDAAPEERAGEALVPLTVCEVLENLDQHADKMVAVVGRLWSNVFDGAWLSENGCSSKVQPSDPHWPYAILLGCIWETEPPPIARKLNFDAAVLGAKLSRLRKTTTLEYYEPLLMVIDGEKPKKIHLKETGSVVFGRIRPAPPGEPSGFGAVRAQAELCSGKGAWLNIEEPDSPRKPQ